MTDYGFCLRPVLHRDECSGFLNLWIEDDRGSTALIPMPYDIEYEEWDPVTGWLEMAEVSGQRLVQLKHYAECMERDLENLERIILDLQSEGQCRTLNILEKWSEYDSHVCRTV